MFRDSFTVEERKKESTRIRFQNPTHIPIIIEPRKSTDPVISKRKYLVPKDITVAQLLYVVRKRIDLKKSQSIFFNCNETMPSTSDLIQTLDTKHSDPNDGFLYITYTLEHTFGCITPDASSCGISL